MQQNIVYVCWFEKKINLQKYIGHDFCNLVIEIFFIIIGYIELLVIDLMFLSKWIYLNYSYQYSIFIVNPVYAVYFAVFTDEKALSNGLC